MHINKEENIKKIWERQLNHIESQTSDNSGTSSNSDGFESIIFPVAMKIAAKTISSDILGFGDRDKMKSIEERIAIENRDGKIDAVVENKEYSEKKAINDPEWIKESQKGVTPLAAPSGKLFYLDYVYNGNSGTSSVI